MIEYTIAKNAGEILSNFIEKNKPQIKIYKPRLPRMKTDQTVSILEVNNKDTLTILDSDEIIRSVELIKEQLSSEKHWAIFVSNEGDIDYAKTDNKNDEQFLKTVLFFEETKQSIGGFILKSGD